LKILILTEPERGENVMKAKRMTASISIAGKSALLLGGNSYAVTIKAQSVDGLFPLLIEVKGDPDVMQVAMVRSRLQLEMFDVKFWVGVAGYRKDVQALLVRAEPFFRALPRCLAIEKLSIAA
jgi:hypothetical protein